MAEMHGWNDGRGSFYKSRAFKNFTGCSSSGQSLRTPRRRVLIRLQHSMCWHVYLAAHRLLKQSYMSALSSQLVASFRHFGIFACIFALCVTSIASLETAFGLRAREMIVANTSGLIAAVTSPGWHFDSWAVFELLHSALIGFWACCSLCRIARVSCA